MSHAYPMHRTGITLPAFPPASPIRGVPGGPGAVAASLSSPSLMFLLLFFLPVNTDTETAVVNVMYATKEEAKV